MEINETHKMRYFFFIIITLLCISIHNCTPKPNLKPYWDTDNQIYFIPQDSLLIDFKNLPESWIIANPDSIPERIVFCTVEQQQNICTMLINPTDKPLAKLSRIEQIQIIKEICNQTSPINQNNIELENLKNNARFSVRIHLKDPSIKDSINIIFIGYFFNRNNSTKVLVSTIPETLYDSLGETTLLNSLYSNISPYNPH